MREFLQSIAAQFSFLRHIDVDGLQIWNNPPSHWLLATIFSVIVGLLARFLIRTGIRRIEKLSERTDTKLDDILVAVLRRTKTWFLILFSLYAGLGILDLGDFDQILDKIMVAVTLIQAGTWTTVLVLELLANWHQGRPDRHSIATAVIAMRFVARILIWTIIGLLMLDNLGIKVVSLLAGLGVGGIAIALAVQRVLGDVLASVSIVLDRPFEIGDAIVVGDMTGTVEHIGLKTTRLRSATGEQLVFSNADLLDSRIRNMKRMTERRNLLLLGVTYQTTAEQLALVPAMLQEIVSFHEELRFDRAHLKNMGDFAIQFELVYWTKSPDYLLHMDMQQKVLLEIVQRFEKQNIHFAYPTQTIHLNAANKA